MTSTLEYLKLSGPTVGPMMPHRLRWLVEDGRPVILKLPPEVLDLSAFAKEDLLPDDQKIVVVDSDSPRLKWDPKGTLPFRKKSFGQFVTEYHEKWVYWQQDTATVPGLPNGDLPEEWGFGSKRTKLWWSGPGLVTPLHYDPAETLHAVVRGAKYFKLYPPGIRDFYPNGFWSTAPFISRVDPDFYSLGLHGRYMFPRFRFQNPLEVRVCAGEILFIPSFWWHQVTSAGPTNISLNWTALPNWKRCVRYWPSFARVARHLFKQARAAAKARRG